MIRGRNRTSAPGSVAPSASEYPWPPPVGAASPVVWSGGGFQLGGDRVSVLTYATGDSGWTDELSAFSEDHAGANHPIDRASRAVALQQVDGLPSREPIILEVGCSSGYMLREMREQLPNALVIGADYVGEPLEKLASEFPDVPLLRFDLQTCPLPDESVDAVVLLNVLEHIEDDAVALRQIFRVLRPGGLAAIQVPAGPGLYDVYDQLLLHRRRYALGALKELVRSTGFEITRASHIGALIYAPFALVKRRNQRYLKQDLEVRRRVVEQNIRSTRSNVLVDTLLRLELFLGKWVVWPFGIRCVVEAHKPTRPAQA